MNRLLITNMNGFLGAGLAAALADRFDVHGVGDHALNDVGCRMVGSPSAEWPAMVRDVEPQWIIHCGCLARGSWDMDESHAERDQAANLAALAAAACEAACRLTVLSTDSVFTGPRLFHREDAPLSEENPRIQHVCELETAAVNAGALVVRTHAYGWGFAAADEGFAQWVWNSLDAGQTLRLSTDRHASPIFVDDLAELLLRAYRRNLRGLYHIAGGERTSQHRFAVELATACGFDAAQIELLPQETAAGGWMPREETSLDSGRARRALEAPLPLLREGLTRFASRQPNRSPTASTLPSLRHAA